jgi:hypothetical protein
MVKVLTNSRGGPGIFAGRGPLQARIHCKFGLEVGQCAYRRLASMRAVGAPLRGSFPRNMFKSRCSEMRLQANPTVQF